MMMCDVDLKLLNLNYCNRVEASEALIATLRDTFQEKGFLKADHFRIRVGRVINDPNWYVLDGATRVKLLRTMASVPETVPCTVHPQFNSVKGSIYILCLLLNIIVS